MPSIKQGQTLTKDDLNVFLYVGGSLSDPFTITYTLYDSTTGTDQIIGLPDRFPIKFGTGQYYAPWSTPDDEPTGLHKIVWKYKESATSDVLTETEEFEIIPLCSATAIQFPDFIRYLIDQLRIKLRDINPDRDYHFAPPSSEATISGFTRVRGYRWPDEQLYGHLVQASNYINLIPPDTDFRLESYPAVWQPILLLQAMSYALWDLSILWISEEFSYSLNGISLDISRSDKYQSAAQSMQDTVNTQLEAAKTRIHIIKGLAQDRYVYGRGAALGPWCCSENSIVYDSIEDKTMTIKEAFEKQIKKSFSMNLETNELIENDVVKIWNNGIQEIYRMIIGNRKIECTKTHKFFSEKNEEIELQNLNVGDRIWIKEKDLLQLAKIDKIDYVGKLDTYDMEMKEPYRNYIAEDIVVHNTGGQNIRRWITGSSSGISFGTGG